jgi:hypothetical protein
MTPPEKSPLQIATTWIREWAQTYLPNEAGFSWCADDLRAADLTLVAVRHVLKHGTVVFNEKLDRPGATWIVEGEDNDGNRFRLKLTVISEEMDVTLENATKIKAVDQEAVGEEQRVNAKKSRG